MLTVAVGLDASGVGFFILLVLLLLCLLAMLCLLGVVAADRFLERRGRK